MITQVSENLNLQIKLGDEDLTSSPRTFSLSSENSLVPQDNVDLSDKVFPEGKLLPQDSFSFKEGENEREMRENIEKTIEKINDKISYLNIELRFKRDEELKKTLIQLFDKRTKKVVKQIPPEDLVKMIKRLKEIESKINSKLENQENLKGLILNLKV